MNRYAHINSSGEIVNICLWDGEAEYKPSGVTLVKDDGTARMGGIWDGNAFTFVEPTPPEPTAEQVAAAETKASAIGKLKALGLNDAEIASITGG